MKLPPTEHLDATAISQLSNDYQRVKFMNNISKALAASSSKLLGMYHHRLKHISLKLSKGLVSLPDELLALTLRYVDHKRELSFQHALRLSHVCRRFRRIVLADPNFWSTLCLCYGTKIENVKRSISRSGNNTDLSITINYVHSTSSSALRRFMEACSSSAARWRSLTVDGSWDNEDGPGSISDKVLQLMNQYHLVLPRLHELHLSESREEVFDGMPGGQPIWETFATNFAGVQAWEAPNLNVLRCTQYIPPPSFPFTSFTSFVLSLHLLPDAVPIQVGEMVAFLASKPNISVLGLELEFTEADSADNLTSTSAVCPAVTSFRLTASYVDHGAALLAGQIVKSLRMPKLETFALSVELWDVCDLANLAGLVPGRMLPGPDNHPLLTSLTVNVGIYKHEPAFSSQASKFVAINIPLAKIPRVSSLCITTFGRVSFSRQRQRRKGRGAKGPSALREVQFISCVNMDVEGLRLAITSLKDVGAWDLLDRVVIKGCDLLDYDSTLEIVGKERLRFMEY